MYPKSKKGEDIYFFGKLLETIEYEKGFPIGTFKIIPLIETTGAVMNIQEICNACPNRVTAVAFGCEDFVTDLGGKHDPEGQSIFTARAQIAMGAKACGVIPIDTVHIRVATVTTPPARTKWLGPRRCSRWPKKPNAKVKGWPSRTISSSGRRWSKWRKPFLTNTV